MQLFEQLMRTKAIDSEGAEPVLAGNSVAAHSMRQLVALAAASTDPVLLTGPIGTGKLSVARAIHTASAQVAQPMIETCGDRVQEDHFAARWEGTWYIDRFSTLPHALQVRLLDWLDRPRSFSVRLIVASEQWPDTERIIAPLRARLERLRIPCPVLAQRKDDIPAMLQRLWAADRDHIPPILERDGWAALLCHDWPGNFRALAVFATKASRVFGGRKLSAEQIEQLLGGRTTRQLDCENFSLKQHLAEQEKMFLIEALLRNNGVIAAAAGMAGLNRTTFLAKMRRYGLTRV